MDLARLLLFLSTLTRFVVIRSSGISKNSLICETRECKIIAEELFNGMDKSVDPCDNFYNFVCGTWVNETTIPPFLPTWSRSDMFQYVVFHRIKEILETSPKRSDILPVRQAKKWYRSCMDLERLNKRGLRDLESILVQTGGWPMTIDREEWDESEHAWKEIEEHYFHITGSHTFYDVDTESRHRNNSVSLTIPQFSLLKYLQRHPNDSQIYYSMYKKILQGVVESLIEYNKASIAEETLQKDIDDLFNFILQLDKLKINATYDGEVMTIDGLVEWHASQNEELDLLDFRHLIRRTFDMINYDIKDATSIFVQSPSYWTELATLLGSTSKRIVVNYIHWNFVMEMMRFTTDTIRDLILSASEENYWGITQRPPRWLECVVEMQMSTAAGYAFVKKYFTPKVEQEIRQIIENIRNEIKSQMNNSPWIDPETRDLAIAKLNHMKFFIGYPDWYKNKTYVINMYKGLTIGSDYFDNILSFTKYYRKQSLRRINNPEKDNDDDDEWAMFEIDPTVVNAFYFPTLNTIQLPAADFQPPLFTSKLPSSINYGIAGSVIGHEMGHGFDDDGIQYGLDGNDTKISKQMLETYYQSADCFIEQYNKYHNVSNSDESIGRITQGENIADSTGLHAVFEAYRTMLEATPGGFDRKLPGFEDFTDDQMFFIAFAGSWCEVSTPQFQKYIVENDVHSSGELRVIGSVSNSKDFARAFNCPKGSAMNPENKCDVWHAPEPYESPGALDVFDAAHKEQATCQTNECNIIAQEFLFGMDTSVDPCDNFYDYMCGGWDNKTSIPPYAAHWNRVQVFQETVYHRISEILDTSPKPSDILPVRQAKKWFQSCMDIETLNKRGIRPIESILIQLGGWPMTVDTEEWDENEHTWQGVEHHYFHLTGSYIFYDISSGWESSFDLAFKIGSLPLTGQISDEFRDFAGNNYDGYAEVIAAAATMFIHHNKANVRRDKLLQDVYELVEFERQLNTMMDTYRYDGIEILTIDEFLEWYKKNCSAFEDAENIEPLDFRRVFQRAFDMVNHDIDGTKKIYVQDMVYWLELTKFLSATPKRTIVNYIHWHFISGKLQYTTETMRDLLFLIVENEIDVKERPPRWLECFQEMEMRIATSYVFVEKYFSESTATAVREMIENIRDEMQMQINTSKWIGSEAKQMAIEKLDTMDIFLGFPEWFKNQTFVVNAYKGLTIGSEYLDNILSFEKFKKKQVLRHIINGNREIDYSMGGSVEVNGYYSRMRNLIELPAADFQAPLFTPKLPRSINYGLAGSIIGHEIAHGFDNEGFKYGPNGNKTKIPKRILEMYFKRADCFITQFNQYHNISEDDYDEDMSESKGRISQAENIADSTGLHAVYEAYRKMIDQRPRGDFKLPGFEDFTDDQMFFISFGAIWCEIQTPKLEKLWQKYNVHSPGRLRAIGAVSNTPDFARAFKCPKGSPMNPENKCDIWDAPEPCRETALDGKDCHNVE